jgi:GNAT superfamily N-acetyltransferase
MAERATPINADHDTTSFDCGKESLNVWLQTQARPARNRGSVATYVWADAARVVAYYAITPWQADRSEVSRGMADGLTGWVPGWLLAKLALDRSLHGRELGGALLQDALWRILAAVAIGSGRLIAVDAIDESAAAFYEQYGFHPVKTNPLRLVIKVSTVRQAAGGPA